MQGLKAALSYLWEEGREGMGRHCLPLAYASCPPLRHASVYTADTQPGLRMGWLGSLNPQWDSWPQGSETG